MLLKLSLKTLIFVFLFSSCSTLKLSSREKIYSSTALGFAGGAVYGLRREQARGKNALLFGASVGLLVSLVSVAIFNEEKKARTLEEKLSKLEEDLGLMYEGSKIQYLTGGKKLSD